MRMHNTVGARLKKGRENKKLSVKDVAKRLNIAESEVTLIENDSREATPYEIEQFANLYKLNPEYIHSGNVFKDDRDSLVDAFKTLDPEEQDDFIALFTTMKKPKN